MTQDEREGPVFNPEGIRRLLAEGGGEDLNDDERALLLAMVGADTETGIELTEEERAALDKLRGQVEGYDADDLAQAVRQMVTSKPRDSRKLKWPKVKLPKLKQE
ncbi:MAG: hypothetical protein V3S14_06310 [Anaerolineae bacterium]